MANPESVDITKFMHLKHFDSKNPDNPRALGEAENSPLHQIFGEHKGYITGKWEQYLSIYQKLFAPFILKGAPVDLLEIGIMNGGSLQVWQKFLPKDSHIVGVDISPGCRNIKTSENIDIFLGDISQGQLLDKELKDKTFDIIIDDASHTMHNVLSNFNLMFQKVNPGGLYIIEDCHTSYWQEYGGGLNAPGSSIEYFKTLVDIMHYYYFKDRNSLSAQGLQLCAKYHSDIACISFYDSVIVLEKYATPKVKPFRNYLFGEDGPVVPKPALLNYGHLECVEDTEFEKYFNT